MSLANGNYFIFNDKRYAGRMLAEPLLFGPLPVVLHDPSIKPQKCELEKRGDKYIIKFGGVPSGVHDDHVYALLSEPDKAEEWTITLRENHGPDLYTIETQNKEKGWIAPENDEDPRILVRMLIVGQSFPPFFPGGELFRIVPAPNEE